MEDNKLTDSKKYIYRSTLLKREGWSDKAVKLFLPNHDKEVVNPYYKSSPPSKLYELSKVELAEETNEFKFFVDKNKSRKLGASKATETKREKILKYISEIIITVPDIEKSQLLKDSVNHYNNWKSNKNYDSYDRLATIDSDEHFLKRITTNYLRHNLTSYEKELDRIFGKVGTNEAYTILKERINAAIVEKYKWLF
jgi:hypothetical protein